MASSAGGVLTLNTSTGEQSVTGLGFTPVAVLFMGTPHQTADNTQGDHARRLLAAATSSSARWCHVVHATDAADPTTCKTRYSSSNVLMDIDDSGAILWEADFVSMDSDGFTIDITTAPGSAFRVFYIAFGGGGAVDAKAGTLVMPTSGSSVAASSFGFAPTTLIAAYGAYAVDTAEANIKFGLAFCDDDGDEACVYLTDQDAAATSRVQRAAQLNKFVYGTDLPNSTLVGFDSTVTLDSDGFTLNISDNPANTIQIGYLALGGDVVSNVVTDTKPTSASDKAKTGVGFNPNALFTFGIRATADSAPSNTSSHLTTGFAAAGTEDYVNYNLLINSSGSEDGSSYNDDGSLIRYSNNTSGSPTVLAQATLKSFDADGFTLTYSVADANADLHYFLAVAASENTAPVSSGSSSTNDQTTVALLRRRGRRGRTRR